jgi:alkylhydroperoxidase/carboxymuconolactone decarboxylase family protein YurZ
MTLTAAEAGLAALLTDVCVGSADALVASLRRAVADGATDVEIDEVLLLGPLYTGYPRTLNAFAAWREMRPHAASVGVSPADRATAGLSAFAAVYGPRALRVQDEIGRLHPDLRAAILEDAYGRVLARPVLSLRLKELCALPVLIATDAPRQLASHVLGARRAGATDEEVLAACETARKRTEPGRFAVGLERVNDTLVRRD